METITLIKGDGVGPELAEATRRCLAATGAPLAWDPCEAGLGAMDHQGTPLPGETLASLEKTGVGLKAPVTTPAVNGWGSINVHLRRHFGLFACVRPCKSYPGVPGARAGVDLVVVRENTEGLYAGIEFAKDADATRELIAWINTQHDSPLDADAAVSIRPTTPRATRRILRQAFDYARRNGRQRVTSAHKANLLRASDGLWLEISREVAKQYPEIAFDDCLVDNLCLGLAQDPAAFDVIVVPNLYGDLVSDLAAGLVGGLGLAPSGHLGERTALFEPVHGSMPEVQGRNRANPVALILSAVMLLRHIGQNQAADRLEAAVAAVLAEKRHLLSPPAAAGATVASGTQEITEAVLTHLAK